MISLLSKPDVVSQSRQAADCWKIPRLNTIIVGGTPVLEMLSDAVARSQEADEVTRQEGSL